MEKDVADFALKYLQSNGAEYAEVRLEHTHVHSVVMKNDVVEAVGFDEYQGVGMRFIANKRLGFVSTNEFDRQKMQAIMDKALRVTQATGKLAEPTYLAEDKAHTATYEVKQKIKLVDLDVDSRVRLLQDGDESIRHTGVNVPARYLSYTDNDTTEYLINSNGTKITARVPKVNMYYFLTIAANGRMAQRYWVYGASGGFEVAKKWNIPEILKQEVLSMQTNLTKGKASPKGVLPIVCGPQVTGIMVHESAGHPYEADRIFGREAAQAGESFVTPAMVGKRIGSEHVTVVDDPTLEGSYGYYLFDNEGVKGRRKHIIKDGMITEFLHNRETAYHMGLPSNGSSRATDFDKESIVRMSNTFLLPGKHKEEELFDGIKKGVYLKNFMEWNIDDKRLNQKYTGAEAYLIENGEVTTPIVNPVLEVSSTKLWPAIDAVAKNLELHAGNCGKGEPMQAIPVYLGGPSIRLRGLRIR